MRPRTLLVVGIGLVLVGLVAVSWAAALAAFLLTTCDNKFGLLEAPTLRCLQPALWQLGGTVLGLVGVVSGVASGLLLRRQRRVRAGT
jgi:hypothetical protein